MMRTGVKKFAGTVGSGEGVGKGRGGVSERSFRDRVEERMRHGKAALSNGKSQGPSYNSNGSQRGVSGTRLEVGLGARESPPKRSSVGRLPDKKRSGGCSSGVGSLEQAVPVKIAG